MIYDKYLIKNLLAEAVRETQDNHTQRERIKLGDLRVGSGGVVTSRGQILSSCPRQARLRMEGIVLEKPDKDRELMFEAGRTNEDIWAEKLKRVWEDKGLGKVRQEEECPVEWVLPSGRKVTGRPDIVLFDTMDRPKIGLELKLVSSVWTARDTLLEGRPKYAHLIQAAHYSAKLGCPFQLWYSCRTDYGLPEMAIRLCPKMGEPGSEYIEYAPYRKVTSKKGNQYNKRITWAEYEQAKQNRERDVFANPLKITPFEQGYQLGWSDNGNLYYQMITDHPAKVVLTEINWEGIKRFYQLVDQMAETGNLGPRPITVKGDGNKAGYSICGYCPMMGACDQVDKKKLGYQEFIDAAKEMAVEVLEKAKALEE